MDVLEGICVICCEDTFVVSGKDKQKFVELLKEHYFDPNQIIDNKFLLQFKEKRSEKSICIPCAYIIECYVSFRNKFKAIVKNNAKKCSICNSGYNITNGTTQLVKDACTALKNMNRARYVPRITRICLECSFCIISWKKITDSIAKYPMGEKTRSKAIKRSHSVDSSSESEQSEASVGNNETPVRNIKMKNHKKNTTMNNSTPKNKYLSKKKLKLENKIEEQLKHLSNVSSQISSKVVVLNKKVIKRVTSDDRMMFDIAHISCQTKNLESLIINKSKKSGSQREIFDDIPLTTRLRNKKNSASDACNQQSMDLEPVKNKRIKLNKASSKPRTKSVETNSDNQSPKMGENKIKKLPRKSLRKKESEVILVSDTDSIASPGRISKKKTINSTPVRISLRLSKGQSSRLAKKQKENNKARKISKTSKTNQCSSCDKKFVKKYNLQLHELEHEASFKPVVRVQKGNKETNSDSEDKTVSDNTEIDDEIIDKQTTENNNVEKGSPSAETNENEKDSEAKITANENEILDESEQIVDDTVLQLEKENDENLKETPEENQKSSSSQDLETAYSDISDGDKNIDSANKKQKQNDDNEKQLDIEDDKDSEENSIKKVDDNLEEQIETSNENSGTKEKIIEDNENSETETDETKQHSGKSDSINEQNNSQDSDQSFEKNEDNVNGNDNETNEETNNSNANKADLQECDKQCEENSKGSAEDNSSNNSDKNIDNSVVEMHEDKDDVINGLKSIVIEDESSNSSNKDEEIKKVGSSEIDKNIDENKSICIEDSPRSNKSEEDNITQNLEDEINDVIDSSQIETNDVDSVKDITHNDSEPNSQSTDKSIHIEDEMEPLHLSPESISSQNSEVNVSNKQKKNSDKYEIVENLLQNLGA